MKSYAKNNGIDWSGVLNNFSMLKQLLFLNFVKSNFPASQY